LPLALIALVMEAASTAEMLVNFYQTTRRNNPEDSHLHTRRLENLKSHFVLFYSAAGSTDKMFIEFSVRKTACD
jgi:hypothetical protein